MEYNKAYNIDAIEGLSKLKDDSIDLIVTSVPYNIGKDYDEHDDNMEAEDYHQLIDNFINESYRVLVEGGRICINIPVMAGSKVDGKTEYNFCLDWFTEIIRYYGFTLREIITWVKTKEGRDYAIGDGNTAWGSWRSPSNPTCRSLSEFIIVAHKGSPKKESHGRPTDITKEEFMNLSKSVWFFPAKRNKLHPCIFPEELPYRLIRFYSYLGDIILDPFCGIGTTLLVAKQLNRKYIGFDISKKYVDLANEKIGQETLLEYTK